MKHFEQIFSREIKPGDKIAYDEHGNVDTVLEVRLDEEADEISILYEETVRKWEQCGHDDRNCWWGPLNGSDPALREVWFGSFELLQAEVPPPKFEAKIVREQNGDITLFKHRAGLWSDTRALEDDEIVEIAILVESKPRYAVKLPVTRETAAALANDLPLEQVMLSRASRMAERDLEAAQREGRKL